MGEASNKPSFTDRIHSWAKAHASDRNASEEQRSAPTLPVDGTNPNANAVDDNARSATNIKHTSSKDGRSSTNNKEFKKRHVTDDTSAAPPPPAPPPAPSQDSGETPPALDNSEEKQTTEKPRNLVNRMIAGSKRFGVHTKNAIFHSWINVLLIFVPVGIAVNFAAPHNYSLIFAMNAIAIIPLAGLLSHATESVASRLGDTMGAFLNVSFGNAVELIIL
jgi:Ca2+:H+ antiporter